MKIGDLVKLKRVSSEYCTKGCQRECGLKLGAALEVTRQGINSTFAKVEVKVRVINRDMAYGCSIEAIENHHFHVKDLEPISVYRWRKL